LPGEPEHLPAAAGVGAELAAGPQNLPAVAGLDRYRQLVRIHSNDHPVHLATSSLAGT